MTVRRAVYLAALCSISCGRDPAPAPHPEQPARLLVSAPPPAASAPAREERPSYSTSVAMFTGDQLTACVDAVIDAAPLDALSRSGRMSPQMLVDDDVTGLLGGEDSVFGDILVKSLGKETVALLLPKGKPQPIGKPCDEQFTGRLVVAGCVVGAGSSTRVALAIQSFDASPRSDRFMRGCLAAKGQWQELPRDSRELRRERLNQRYRDLLAQ